MADPFRQPWWREAWVLLVVSYAGIAGLFALAHKLWKDQLDDLRAQKPEIVYATYLGTGPVVRRRLRPQDTQAAFVRLDDGSQRMFSFSGPGRYLDDCKVGEPIRLEQRGLTLSLARKPCPEVPASEVEARKE